MTIELPNDFMFDVEQAAKLAGCSPQTIRAHIERYINDPSDRYAIRARQNTPGGKIWIYASDLKDYLERTVIGATVTIK
jgi:hypothetical protein